MNIKLNDSISLSSNKSINFNILIHPDSEVIKSRQSFIKDFDDNTGIVYKEDGTVCIDIPGIILS